MKFIEDVDANIASVPKEFQKKLEVLQVVIKEVAPNTEERISYGMPYYGYKGRLVYFAFAKKHLGLYIPHPVLEEFHEELKDYQTAKATIQLSWDKDLPATLIKKLTKARLKKNEESDKKS